MYHTIGESIPIAVYCSKIVEEENDYSECTEIFQVPDKYIALIFDAHPSIHAHDCIAIPTSCWCYCIRSNTNHTSLPKLSILLLPTASNTSSNGLPSTTFMNRFVFGRPIPPANNCHVGDSIVTLHAVIARNISPSCIPALNPLPSGDRESTYIRPGVADSSERMRPSGNGACTVTMHDSPTCYSCRCTTKEIMMKHQYKMQLKNS